MRPSACPKRESAASHGDVEAAQPAPCPSGEQGSSSPSWRGRGRLPWRGPRRLYTPRLSLLAHDGHLNVGPCMWDLGHLTTADASFNSILTFFYIGATELATARKACQAAWLHEGARSSKPVPPSRIPRCCNTDIRHSHALVLNAYQQAGVEKILGLQCSQKARWPQ